MDLLEFSDEILWHVISFLTPKDVVLFGYTCKHINHLLNNDILWKRIAQNFTDLFKYKPTQSSYKQFCIILSDIHKENNSNFYGDINGIGILVSENRIITGNFKEKKPNGYAIIYNNNNNHNNEDICEGEWVNGEMIKGKYTFSTGDHYDGEWKNGNRHGKGKYVFNTGECYEGELNNNTFEGKGKYFWKNGYYDGEWKNSQFHGNGSIIYTDENSKYIGSFDDGYKFGYGEYYWPDCAYKGNWKDDKRSGYAELTCTNGMVFKGYYKSDLRNGSGTLYWPDGDKYEGNWENGGRVGKGILYRADGSIEEQYWNEISSKRYSKFIPSKYPD